MKLLVDACVAASANEALSQAGHEAEAVADWVQDPGDLAILAHVTEHQQSVVTLLARGAIVTVEPGRVRVRPPESSDG